VKTKLIIFLAVVPTAIFFDLWTKALAVDNLCRPLGEYEGMASCVRPTKVVHVVDGFMSLRYVENRGAAWGIGRELSPGIRTGIFVGISGLAIIFLLYFLYRTPAVQRLLLTALALVLGGAVGNLVDRVRYGYVVDFVDWYVGEYSGRWHWPTFNIADAAIVIGIALLAIEMVVGPRHEESPAAED